jgi:hypothetical protein
MDSESGMLSFFWARAIDVEVVVGVRVESEFVVHNLLI